MALRILMTGDDYNYLNIDAEMLRQCGFAVYLCDNKQIVNELIEEVKPDVVFINSKNPDKHTTDLYHKLIDNVIYASLPVIFTLSEDDVYLVNKKRTTFKDRRYIMSDSILDAIKLALSRTTVTAKKRPPFENPFYTNLYNSKRA